MCNYVSTFKKKFRIYIINATSQPKQYIQYPHYVLICYYGYSLPVASKKASSLRPSPNTLEATQV